MSEQLNREEVRRRVRARAGRPDPAASENSSAAHPLLLAAAISLGSWLVHRGVLRALERVETGADAAGSAGSAGIWRGLAATALARVATGSVPGAAVVGTGLLGKLLYDRARARNLPAPAAPEPPAEEPLLPGA